ncbi:hypothetical protein WJX84_005539 [Apatococcus fuscideae]|uniref:Amine oxidase domain-containing protein n=1 Tax=Apatococcus fuscideae TaxID=2026836 RepID=A0AAW1SV57_9CHLO
MAAGQLSAANQPLTPRKKIAVIGAGFGGLGAAKLLKAEARHAWDIDVTVLESGQRVGGRACTLQLPDTGRVELGATWLHGLKGNPMYELALQYGLMNGSERKQAGASWGSSFYVREGHAQPLSGAQIAAAREAAKSFSASVEESFELATSNPRLTVGGHLQEKWRQIASRAGEMPGEDGQVFAEVWWWRELMQRLMDGCATTDHMLAAGLAAYEELPGPNVPVTSGYQALAMKLSEGVDIRYGCTVQKIAWNADGVEILCADRTTVCCDAVISTIPLGVLKANHEQLFEPQLPLHKIAAIQALGVGIVDKIFIHFEPTSDPQDAGSAAGPASLGQSIRSPVSSFAKVSEHMSAPQEAPAHPDSQPCMTSSKGSGSSKARTRGDAARSQHATAAPAAAAEVGSGRQQEGEPAAAAASQEQRSSPPVVSYHLLWRDSNLYAQDGAARAVDTPTSSPQNHTHQERATDSSRSQTEVSNDPGGEAKNASGIPSWAKGLCNLRFGGSEFVREAATATPSVALDAASAHSQAEAPGSDLDALDMEAASDAEVAQGISQAIRAFPALHRIPRRVRVLRSRWGSDPLSQGSYSYVAAGASLEDVARLAQPLIVDGPAGSTVPRVCFAGEATHVKFIGTTHGAYMSGQREARRLLKAFDL